MRSTRPTANWATASTSRAATRASNWTARSSRSRRRASSSSSRWATSCARAGRPQHRRALLDAAEPEVNLAVARQKITVKQGIEQPVAKKIVAAIKAAKLKVEAQINGEKLRVTGKKRDDLQLAIALLRKGEFEVPLQFDNFRD